MQNVSKILVFLCLCFLANIAVAEDEDIISLERLKQIKKEQNEYWLQFLAQALYYDDSPDALARLAFAKKHFTPLWYEIITNDKGQKVADTTICADGDASQFCRYALKKPPLKLKGTLTIKARYGSIIDCTDDNIPYSAVFDVKKHLMTFFVNLMFMQLKTIKKKS